MSSTVKSNVRDYRKPAVSGFLSMPENQSARDRITYKQRLILIGLFIFIFTGLIVNWYVSTIILFGLISALYFSDLIFFFILIYRSYSKTSCTVVSETEINDASGRNWPVYTLLCPLYREGSIVRQLILAIEALEYPKHRLQVLLLLEADDNQTAVSLESLQIPTYFRRVTVPEGQPQTKPKALNFGLRQANGSYLTIYDAEDIPDPLQLKKSVLAFEKSPPDLVCLQASLDFYNPDQNLITRIFTAEYALWFNLILTGLQSLNAPIPLGGTSNHFRTKDLKHLGGWDPYNVTEDCDLGMRLSKMGMRTGMINSVTREEANSQVGNWLRQRSRWIKGYIQTFFVHNRRPLDFCRNWKCPNTVIFELIVGGKVLSAFINPLMWLMTIGYFSLRPVIGSFIDSLFPTPVLYMAVFSLIFGNFLYMYAYMIGCIRLGKYSIVKYAFLVPFYWLAMNLSAWSALYQFIYKPYYWAKTNHGLTRLRYRKFGFTRLRITSDIFPVPRKFFADLAGMTIRVINNRYLFNSAIAMITVFMFAFAVYLFGPVRTSPIFRNAWQLGVVIELIGLLPAIIGFAPLARTTRDGPRSHAVFIKVLGITSILTAFSFVSLVVFGHILIYPEQEFTTLPFIVNSFAFPLIYYHLFFKRYRYVMIQLFSSAVMVIGLIYRAEETATVVSLINTVSLFNLTGLTVWYVYERNARFVVRGIRDLLLIFRHTEREIISGRGLRVLIFNWRDIRHIYAGGAEVYIYELSRRWVSAGHHVTIFCGNDGYLPRNEYMQGVRIIRRGGFYLVYMWALLYYIFLFRGKYDVIIDSQNGVPFFTPVYAKEPIYCLMHHVHQEVFHRSLFGPIATVAQFIEKRLMPIVYRNIPFIAVSNSTREEMVKLGLGKAGIDVLYCGVDTQFFRPGRKSAKPMVLYLGRLKLYKSLHVLLESAVQIIREVPDMRLVIAGYGEEKDNLIQVSKNLGIEKMVTFLGRVSEVRKQQLLRRAWVFVNPSMMEGWGITVLEANASGTPVVASDVPGLRESVKNPHVGYLVPYADVNAFSRRITTLLCDKPMRDRMSRQAIGWAKKYQWNRSARLGLRILRRSI